MPSKLDTLSFLEKCFGEYQLSNAGLNASVICPICKEKKGITYDKKKLVIRTTDFALHCWVCGYKSKNLYKLIYTYRKSLLKEYIEKFQDKTKIVNQDFISGSSFQEKIETLIFGNKANKNEFECLKFAKKQGNKLIVALNSDDSVKRLKGEKRPIYSLEERMKIISSLEFVDYVTWFEEDTPLEIIKKIKPKKIVKGGDYRPEDVIGKEYAEVIIFNLENCISTTEKLKILDLI